MRRMKLVSLMVLAVLALSATMSASANANSLKNPSFLVEGVGIGLGGEEIVASAVTTQVLKAPNITIECGTFSLNGGSKLLPEGENRETISYGSCSVNGKPECKVQSEIGGIKQAFGTIETEPLDSKLVWKSATAAANDEQTKTDTLFKPNSGELFTKIVITGAFPKCPLGTAGTHEVKGEVLVENEENAAEAVTHNLLAPLPALGHFWVNNEVTLEAPKEGTVNGLEVTPFGNSTYSGESAVKMKSGKEWKVTG